MTREGDQVAQHQLALLRATVQHAVETTPYYSERRHEYPQIRSLDEYSDLPIVRRQDIQDQPERFQSSSTSAEFVRNTSGTTYGAMGRDPLTTWGTWDESHLWQDLIPRPPSGKPQPLAVRFLSIEHGIDPIAHATPGVLGVPLERPAHFNHLTKLLKSEHSLSRCTPRVEILVGTLSRIQCATLLAMQEETPPKHALRSIWCHSQRLTPRWKRALESFWGCEVNEIYGLSEIPGLVGTRCSECSLFHLSPLAYMEYVDIETGRPVSSGPARLVATAYYPLAQASPMIRYDTEDLVEICAESCPASSAPSLEYLGRADSTCTLRVGADTRPVLAPCRLHDVLDEEPSVSRHQSVRGQIFGLPELGFLRYEVDWFEQAVPPGTSRLLLRIELQWHPRTFPRAASELRNRVAERVLEEEPLLRELVARGSVELVLDLLGPGELGVVQEV